MDFFSLSGVWMQRFHRKNSDFFTELPLSLPCSAALPRFRCRFKTGASQVQPAWYILISIDIQRLTWLTVDPGDAGPGKNKKLSHQGTIVCSSMVSIFTRSASLWNQRPRICCFLKMTFTAGKRRIQAHVIMSRCIQTISLRCIDPLKFRMVLLQKSSILAVNHVP